MLSHMLLLLLVVVVLLAVIVLRLTRPSIDTEHNDTAATYIGVAISVSVLSIGSPLTTASVHFFAIIRAAAV